jgi:DNA invertase Pin-like site-specific DNA recombinase
MWQIMGVFSQLEKTRLVKKLKAARDRKRPNGKVEGRKSHLEARPPDPGLKLHATPRARASRTEADGTPTIGVTAEAVASRGRAVGRGPGSRPLKRNPSWLLWNAVRSWQRGGSSRRFGGSVPRSPPEFDS